MRERIDGIKYYTESLTDEELVGIRAFLLDQHSALIADLDRVEQLLAERSQDELPFGEVDGTTQLQ